MLLYNKVLLMQELLMRHSFLLRMVYSVKPFILLLIDLQFLMAKKLMSLSAKRLLYVI